MINKTISLLFLFILLFSFHASTSHAEQLVTTVDGTNVNLDWSAMPEAPSYTLYYALADFKGDIDINTLGWIEMGNVKSLYVPGLPSGLIIFTAVVAHTSGGDVVSNISQFMGFGGTVTFPETGNVLMNVDDPGGIGTFSIVGTKNADGSNISISRISGDDGSGPFVLYITDDRPVSYKKGELTVNFIYHADGSVGFETVRDESFTQANSVAMLAAYEIDGTINCNQYASRDEYKSALLGHGSAGSSFNYEVSIRAGDKGFPFGMLKKLSLMVFLPTPEARVIYNYYIIVRLAYNGIRDEVLEEKLSAYDNQCNRLPPEASGCGECPIPPGAQYESYVEDGELGEYYQLNGHYAGPYMKWYDETLTRPQESRCYDENGELHGARCLWFENGATRKNLYYHGDLIENILWFASGNLNQEIYYYNGEMVEVITYYDNPNALKNHFRYKNGVADGVHETWYENGHRKDVTNYVQGVRIDRYFYSEEYGTRIKFCTYYENGLVQECTFYNEIDETPEGFCTYENDGGQECTWY
ncbi:MAG: hypothetical protein U9N63_03735 [Pseudomonadota bacterium]|nr:hypothetical protein [Pseudomonadota bacterium]